MKLSDLLTHQFVIGFALGVVFVNILVAVFCA